jgi:sigma-B regulation protein RsbU (phosphoserine phosphatase)
MSTAIGDTYFQEALVERRELLRRAARHEPRAEIARLLSEVDAALARLDHGTYGTCVRCHGQIEPDRLVRDPLAEYCREHPGPSEAARVQQDLALAREIQRRLLPRPDLRIDGWRYGFRYEPAGDVGGDFVDVIARPAQGETLVLVGDVSGKGIAASMLMSHLVATFRSLAPLALPAGELLARVNDLFHDSAATSIYATLAAAALRPDGTADLYSAGHWTPLLRGGAGTAPTPVSRGLPLGLFPGSRYDAAPVALSAGDTLLFFTDGAIDAENEAGEDYGVDRLTRALAGTDRAGDTEASIDRLLQDVKAFQHGQPPVDDLLLVGVSRAAPARDRAHRPAGASAAELRVS